MSMFNTKYAHHTNITFVKVAVRVNISPYTMRTASKWGLWACTLHVLQPYFARPLSIPPKAYHFVKTQLSTSYLRISHIPVIIRMTHCSPLTTLIGLYNACASNKVKLYFPVSLPDHQYSRVLLKTKLTTTSRGLSHFPFVIRTLFSRLF